MDEKIAGVHLPAGDLMPAKLEVPVEAADWCVLLEAVLERVLVDGVNGGADHSVGAGQ